jgi:hypothetical protein
MVQISVINMAASALLLTRLMISPSTDVALCFIVAIICTTCSFLFEDNFKKMPSEPSHNSDEINKINDRLGALEINFGLKRKN